MLARMSADPAKKSALNLLSSYPRDAQDCSELFQKGGEVRTHWRALFSHVETLGRPALDQRWLKAQHLLHENGVSYNVYGDPQGQDRPWQLSTLPIMVSTEDFQTIETALKQRARLLDLILRDIYGAQRTLAEGLLPPALVFANPGFLRACHHLHTPQGRMLCFYAADIVRGENGNFSIIGDRTQVPSGSGYALENRLIISGVFPEAFRACNIERLAVYFHAVRNMLRTLSPHNRDNPRIVLLTPGPYNSSYFEQAYLAQYLGYTLVSGEDITVRNNRAYLKTLGGLQPVDVVLRRVNDDYCDPLELRPDSMLGAPGLVQAARVGNVAIANPLGSGAVQSPAFLPYLPKLCEHLLAEPLLMPSVSTWWCGEGDALREATARFDDVVVKPTFSEGYVRPIMTAQLSSSDRNALLNQIQHAPDRYVVQERTESSTVPVLVEGKLQPRKWVMRCFAVAGSSDYAVMPGALSRVAKSIDGTEISLQLGAASTDTWIVGDGSSEMFSLLPSSGQPMELSRGGSDLPSRATDNLFWLGRYAERAEALARVARTLSARVMELGHDRDYAMRDDLHVLLFTLQIQTSGLDPSLTPATDVSTIAHASAEILNSIFSSSSEGTLKSVVNSALRSGKLVRDRISTDTWRILAALDDELVASERKPSLNQVGVANEVLGRIILRLAAFSGLVMDSMTRGYAWRFLDLGRRIERALSLLTLLRSAFAHPTKNKESLLEIMLEVADSGMTYRRRYLANVQTAPVVDLLLTDESNPRSMIFQLQAIHEHIVALPNAADTIRSPQERLSLELLTELKLVDVMSLCAERENDEHQKLQAMLTRLATKIPELSDSLSNQYLAHATTPRHLLSVESASKSIGEANSRDLP